MLPDLDPPEAGNEDPATYACLCAHPDSDHILGDCLRPLCGCVVFRPDPRQPARTEAS
jgi:hypothetical protein